MVIEKKKTLKNGCFPQHFQRPWKKRTLYQRRFIAERRLFSKCWWRPKKQHFPAFSQKFYFALVRINSHISKNERKNAMFGRCKFRAKQRPFHAKQCTFHAKQCTFHGLSMVCPWSNFLKIWKSQIHTNSYSAQVFPSIFNCGDLYCNFGHLSSRRGQDAKKRPLWVKKHPFCKGRLKNVRGSLGFRVPGIG